MKYTITLFLLTASSRIFGQEKISPDDTARPVVRQRLVTVAPLTGGVNVNYMMTPIGGDNPFTINQLIVDESSTLYRGGSRKHPLLVRGGFRYQGLYLAGEDFIGVTNFHSITVPVTVTYIVSRNTSITGIGTAGIASDFRKDPSASDMLYNAGVRFGFRQTKNFKLGVMLIYSNSYAGRTLLPLIDFEWKISEKWKLESVLPVRTSLKYQLDKRQILALTQGFNSVTYRLNDSSRVGKYLQFQQISAGLMYERALSRHWIVNLIAGYAFSQRLQTFTNDQKISFNDLGAMKDRVKEISYEKAAMMLQAGLIFRF